MASTFTALRILQISSQYIIYTGYVTFTIGIIGNAINILIFTHFKFFRNNRCAFYLTIESMSNFISLFCSGILNIFVTIYGTTLVTSSLVWCRLVYVLAQTLGLITFSMICLISFDQFFSTDYRLNLRSICTLKLAQWLAFISIFICFVHGITCSFFVNIVPLVGCVTTNPILIRYFTYFFYPILTGFLPIITVSIFSLFAFRNVRHIIRRQVPIERRRLDLQITAMVLLRMGFFVAFTLPYISFRIYIVNVTVKKTDLLQYAIIQLIQAIIFSIAGLNIATSCYIFAISSSRYRRQIKYVLVKKCWQRWKSWCCFHNNRIQPENAISLGSNFELD